MEPSAQIHSARSLRLMLVLLGALVLFALLHSAGGSEPAAASKTGKGTRGLPQPNIVMILTDDQPAGTVTPEAMPNLHQLIIDPGSSFSDYIVTTPLCCPSRASVLSGAYGHNNGVLRNDYANLIGKKNVLPVWLQRAGYNTAHLGKWLNEYEDYADKPQDVAPGWDLWFTQLESRRYYDYKASKNGKKLYYGERDKDHVTDVTSKFARRWTQKLAAKDDPFYMQLDYYAPHGAAGRPPNICPAAPVPSPQDEGAFSSTPILQPPNFNEADVSDKPPFIQALPSLTPEEIDKVERRYRCTIESMLGVDRGIAQVYNKIEKAGELDQTIFIFASDNGYYFGEHRIPKGKLYPYEENLRMPLSILIPEAYRKGAPVQSEIDDPAANIDLAPTMLDLAGADPCRGTRRCRTMDGRSLVPILDGTGGVPNNRAFLVELQDCQYRGVRFDHQIYFEYGASAGKNPDTDRCEPSAIEHYDIDADPYQLENLFPSPRRTPEAKFARQAQKRMSKLSHCAGIEGRDPEPASGEYCE